MRRSRPPPPIKRIFGCGGELQGRPWQKYSERNQMAAERRRAPYARVPAEGVRTRVVVSLDSGISDAGRKRQDGELQLRHTFAVVSLTAAATGIGFATTYLGREF
jgi:hypothetical protein